MPEWSPDGRHIVYSEVRAGRTTVWKASGSGENAEQLTEATGWVARWSPDGSTIHFIRDDNLWAVSADGADERQLTDLVGRRGLVDLRALATDGRYLYFTWRLDTGDIWAMDVVTEE